MPIVNFPFGMGSNFMPMELVISFGGSFGAGAAGTPVARIAAASGTRSASEPVRTDMGSLRGVEHTECIAKSSAGKRSSGRRPHFTPACANLLRGRGAGHADLLNSDRRDEVA